MRSQLQPPYLRVHRSIGKNERSSLRLTPYQVDLLTSQEQQLARRDRSAVRWQAKWMIQQRMRVCKDVRLVDCDGSTMIIRHPECVSQGQPVLVKNGQRLYSLYRHFGDQEP